MKELAWFLIGACAMGTWMLAMLFYSKRVQHRWLRVWGRESRGQDG